MFHRQCLPYMQQAGVDILMRCTISQIYFGKELYMFQTDLLFIIRSVNPLAPEFPFKF